MYEVNACTMESFNSRHSAQSGYSYLVGLAARVLSEWYILLPFSTRHGAFSTPQTGDFISFTEGINLECSNLAAFVGSVFEEGSEPSQSNC